MPFLSNILVLGCLAGGCSASRAQIANADASPGIPEFIRSLIERTAEPAGLQIECKAEPCIPRVTYVGAIRFPGVLQAIKWLQAAQESGAQAVVIELNSPGGDIDSGFLLIRAIEDMRIPSYCVAEHEVASEAYAILQSCTHRMMTKRTQLMTHDISYSLAPVEKDEGTPKMLPIKPVSQATKLLNLTDNLGTASRAHAEQCQHRMKVSIREYLKHVSNGREWYMDWEEAVRAGAVDGIVDSVPALESYLRKSVKPQLKSKSQTKSQTKSH